MGNDCMKSTVVQQGGNEHGEHLLANGKTPKRGRQLSGIGEPYLQQLEAKRNKMIQEKQSKNESDRLKLQDLNKKLKQYQMNGKKQKQYGFQMRKKKRQIDDIGKMLKKREEQIENIKMKNQHRDE